ncbi:hypothetical protein N836_09225 [Leptolyngbya sp. Heron Island J]|nr:hypothetical protein N836_09225 [Leptolyngbya sp. Heron Island J]
MLGLFLTVFSGLIFMDYQFNDWEAESQENSSLATRSVD